MMRYEYLVISKVMKYFSLCESIILQKFDLIKMVILTTSGLLVLWDRVDLVVSCFMIGEKKVKIIAIH